MSFSERVQTAKNRQSRDKMKIINVDASKKYDVIIGERILSSLGKKCLSLFGKSKAVIVTDRIV